MESSTALTVRPYDAVQDYDVVSFWREERGLNMPHPSWIPSTSWVCQEIDGESGDGRPMGFLALYMDSSVGVCHLDWLTTRPQLGLNMAHRVADALLSVAQRTAEKLYDGPFVMLGSVQSEAMANQVRRHGFTPSEPVYPIAKGVQH